MARILIIDDDEDLRCFLQAELKEHGYVVQGLERAEQGPEVLRAPPSTSSCWTTRCRACPALIFWRRSRNAASTCR